MADYTTVEPLFDYERGDFVTVNGRVKLVSGKNRIQNWINKILRTQINKYDIHRGTGYGIDTESVIGRAFSADYAKSEIRRKITEAFLKKPSIISIDNFTMELDGSRLIMGMTVNTEYGVVTIDEREW